MRRFAALYQALDRSTGTLDKRAALAAYFRDAPAEDAAWALWLLAGGKVGGARARIAGSRELRGWIAEASGTPELGNPGANGFGTTIQGYLEGSNVNVVTEMVNMIVAQRAYEINSKAIQTSDAMLQEVNNLKR